MRLISSGTIDLLHAAMQIGSLAIFVLYVALGIRVLIAPPQRRRRTVNQFLLYAIGVHAFLIAVQKDAWPFSVYPMMARVERNPAAEHQMITARAVDTTGREWLIDPLAWSPLYPPSTLAWFDVGFPSASANQRSEVMRFLLTRAEDARHARTAGQSFFSNSVVLGPLTAPDTNLYWATPDSPLPFHSLRIYRVRWNPTAFLEDPRQITRRLLCEYP